MLVLLHIKKNLLPILVLHVIQVLIRRQMERVNVLPILSVLQERIHQMEEHILKIHVLTVFLEHIRQH